MSEYNKQILSNVKENSVGILTVYALQHKTDNYTLDVIYSTKEKAEKENTEFLGNRYNVIEMWLA